MAQKGSKILRNEDITTPLNQISCPTPLGTAIISEHGGFIRSISITDTLDEHIASTGTNDVIRQAIIQLDEYFAGTRLTFNFPVQPHGTLFQQEVWRTLFKIEYGKTMSYAGLSKQMNNPLAIRAIAAANGQNPLWVVVPCHRVIGSNGSLTGYAGGLWRKQWLLEHEAKVLGIGQVKLEF